MKDYYRILGVLPDVSEQEIKTAYRKLAKKYHPDVISDKPELKDKMYDIQAAFEVLGDEKKRAEYDKEVAIGTKVKRPEPSRTSSAPDMSRFESFFGFSPMSNKESYKAKTPSGKSEGPIPTDALFASYFGKKK